MTPSNQSRRLVLASGFVNAGLAALIQRHGWTFLHSIAPGPAAATEFVWKIDEEDTFHVFECTNYPLEYCIVVGTNANAVLMRISTELEFLDVDDLAAAFDRAATAEEKRITTFALGLAAGDPIDETIVSRIRAAFLHAGPAVRLAAIDAAFVTEWATFKSDLARLAAEDADPEVRGTAANAVRDFPGSGVPQ